MGKIDGAKLMAQSLKQQGVDYMFGIVGFPVQQIAAEAAAYPRVCGPASWPHVIEDDELGPILQVRTPLGVPEHSTRGPRLGGMDPQYTGVSVDGMKSASADGFAVYGGTGEAMLISSTLGNAPWTVLAQGLSTRFPISIGLATFLVSAAVLSDRYITSRFLPDKAIDIVDEAASRLRMEIDSSPIEIDTLQRSVDRLLMEELALANEQDDASRTRSF